MPKIDNSIHFKPINIAILTVSDSRSPETDKSGNILAARLISAGHKLADKKIIKDEISSIQDQLKIWINDKNIDAVISTGGTGLTGRDVTPEAFMGIYEKEISGFGELFRMLSYKTIGTSTIQSRATAGVVGGTYLFALPGSPGACKDGWDMILKEQLDIRHKPCNLVEIMPRLNEHLG
jgi:molybdenum cofactor biosynthesis protein B